MGTHKLGLGQRIIDILTRFGRVLGYHSRREWPIPDTGERPQAIDLCWFFDSQESAPLFAFEIETKDTSAAQGNANKMFAKSVDQLQKPLFFFHLFLDEREDSTRKKDLLALYGRFNYAVCSLQNGSLLSTLEEILRQHRRLTDRLDFFALGKLVSEDPTLQTNVQQLFKTAMQLGFERGKGTRLDSFGKLVIAGVDVRENLLQELAQRLLVSKTAHHEHYGTWLGEYYQEVFHWAMLARLDPSKRDECVDAIKKWQCNGGTTPYMIGGMLGRRLDYDSFVFCWSPAIWAMLASLIGDSPRFRRFACEQIDYVVRETESTGYSPYLRFSGLWMLFIAIWDPTLGDYLARSKQIIVNSGGVPESALANPPSVLLMQDGDDFPGEIDESMTAGHPLDVSQADSILRASVPTTKDDDPLATLRLAFEMLIDDDGVFEKGVQIASALSRPSQLSTF